jgi:hypothetical protein
LVSAGTRRVRVPAHTATAVRRFAAAVVAGGVTGFVVGGVGGRLAMLLLRLTSGDGVHGVVSDDGFVIGRFTLAGTLSLLALGTAIGILGALVHRLVVPWLIGPRWFRRVTTAAGSGVVVGAMLVHRGGIDFTRLRPAGLAIALFVLIPAAYGALIGPVQEYCDRPDSWLNRHRARRWAAPILTLALVPPLVPMLAVLFLVAWGWAGARERLAPEGFPSHPVAEVMARVPWVAIVALGLLDLVRDTAGLL